MRKTSIAYSLLSASFALIGFTACGGDDDDSPDENRAPLASIEGPSSGEVGAEALFDGSASSDPDGDTLLYNWSLEAPAASALGNAFAEVDSFEFTPDAPGLYTVTLQVSDGALTSTKTAMLDVAEAAGANSAPIAVAGADLEASIGESIALNGFGSTDPDGDALTYQWAVTEEPSAGAAALSGADSATASLIGSEAGDYTVSLTVTDPEGLSSSDEVVVRVGEENDAPSASINAPQAVEVGQTVSLNGSASSDVEDDAAGQDLTYTWDFTERPQGSAAAIEDASAPVTDFVADQEGVYRVELVVTDSAGAEDSQTVVITAGAANAPPVAEAGPDLIAEVGQAVSLDGSASSDAEDDAAGVALTYAWSLTGAPPSSSAAIEDAANEMASFTPDQEGVYRFELSVTDADGQSATDSMVLTVTEPVPDLPPVADAGADQSVETGMIATLDASGSSDAEDDAAGTALTYAWSIVSAPAGSTASLSAANIAAPEFTPDLDGAYEFSVTVTDSAGQSSTDSVIVTAGAATPTTDNLIISQVVEGSNKNRVVEIYNAGTTTIDLTPYHLTTVYNGNSTQRNGSVNLSGMLAPGAVQVFCQMTFDVTKLPVGVSCTAMTNMLDFDGDDAVVLYIEGDGMVGFHKDRAADVRVDVFGELGVRPATKIYGNAGYDRCDPTPYDGNGAFSAGRYTKNTTLDDFAGIGTAPATTCAGSLP